MTVYIESAEYVARLQAERDAAIAENYTCRAQISRLLVERIDPTLKWCEQ